LKKKKKEEHYFKFYLFENMAATKKLKFRTDFEKSVLLDNFQARGWTRLHSLFY